MFDLAGRVAVISGSTRGVGLAVASMLSRAGASVVLNYALDDEKAEKALLSVTDAGGKAIAVKADVSRREGAHALVATAEREFGAVDILVNNTHGRITRKPFAETTWEEHAAQVEAVLGAAYHLTRAALPGMQKRGYGRVVNVGNNMVQQPIKGYSALTSAMAALMGFTRDTAAEFGQYGITVNMVSPGFVMTEEAPHTNESVREAIRKATPLGRLAVPEDVAGAVLFFCSEAGRFVTGANLSTDGGKVMG